MKIEIDEQREELKHELLNNYKIKIHGGKE